MKTRADQGMTNHNEPYVLPELYDFTQTLIDPEKHFVEFDRVAKRRLK